MSASIAINSLVFKALTSSTVTVRYLDQIPLVAAIAAAKTLQTVHYVADTAGTAGNAITIAIAIDVDPGSGSEHVSVSGSAITVHLFNYNFGLPSPPKTLATAADVVGYVNGYGPSAALVTASLTDAGATIMNVGAATALTGGAAAIPAYPVAGSEIVTVSGDDITVRIQSGVTTIAQIKAAIEALPAAAALVSMTIASGDESTTQTAPTTAYPLAVGIYLKGCSTTGTAGFFAGQQSRNLTHDHGGATGSMNNLSLNGDASNDTYYHQDHTHTIPSDLSVVDFEPAHVIIKQYIKIR